VRKALYIPFVAVMLVLSGCGLRNRMDRMAEGMDFLGQQMQESNRRLANVEESTVKMAKALP
jgi:hypothetical protein